MKICAAQLRPVAGNVTMNTAKHLEFIKLAVAQQADVVFFPELSLTGFEPRLASSLAVELADQQFLVFQELSDQHRLLIGVGMPIAVKAGVQIGMVWFTPGKARQLYAKQQLHIDETPYFIPGDEQLVLERGGMILAPAICYESLQIDHADKAVALAAEVYLASVAKPANGIARGAVHYPDVARRHTMPVIMANCIGPCDNFISVGQSAAWNNQGELLAQMDRESEGMVILDTQSESASVISIA